MFTVKKGKSVKISDIPKNKSFSSDLVDKMRAELHRLNEIDEEDEDEKE